MIWNPTDNPISRYQWGQKACFRPSGTVTAANLRLFAGI